MPQPTFETILYAVEDGIATITLNRPDRLNAFTNQMMLDMIAAFDATDADDAVRVVIVTGAGRGFCAGADLSGGGATFDRNARPDPTRDSVRVNDVERDGGGRLTLRIYESLKPVIAAVNGPAVGVGVTMQLAMDIRMASTQARYGFVFARRDRREEVAIEHGVERRRPPGQGRGQLRRIGHDLDDQLEQARLGQEQRLDLHAGGQALEEGREAHEGGVRGAGGVGGFQQARRQAGKEFAAALAAGGGNASVVPGADGGGDPVRVGKPHTRQGF